MTETAVQWQVWGIELFAPEFGYRRAIVQWPKNDFCGRWFDAPADIAKKWRRAGRPVRVKPPEPDKDFETGC
jgi:hypothetical protein